MADDPVQELLHLARVARGMSLRMDARRVALSRFALVWWHGGAAEAYQRAVQERVNALAALSARLEELARAYEELAAECAVEAVAERLFAAGVLRLP